MTYHKIVIPSIAWQFFDFTYKTNSNAVENWYCKQDEETQDMFTQTVDSCRDITNHLDWPHFRPLRGEPQKSLGIWEIGFCSLRREYRILGIFNGKKRAVLLGACFHKQRIYSPPEAIPTACDKAKLLGSGGGKLCERKKSSI